MKDQVLVGTFWCRDVLERLQDYADGTLAADERARVDEHLAGCTRCAAFGSFYGELVEAIRDRIAPPEPLGAELSGRLVGSLRREREG